MARNKRLKEAPIDYSDGPERMSPDIEQKLRSQEHPLGGHPAFPDIDGDGIPDNFEELIASKRFRDVVEKVKSATGLERVDPMALMSMQPMFQRALMKAMQIESQHKQALEKLAVDLVKTEMGIPEGDLQFDAKIKKPSLEGMQTQPQKPKEEKKEFENPQEEQEAAERLEKFNLERQKRRFINSIIQGSSKKALYLYHMIDEKLNEINPELVNLYSLLMSVNDLMYWVMPDMDMRMAAGGGQELGGGREELDLETDPPTIKAEGALFPILVHELYKGVMDYVSSHGLPSDPSTAEAVIGMEDTLPAEVWDLRLGPVIWEKFRESYPPELFTSQDRRRLQNYFYFKFVNLPAEQFIDLAKKILSGSDEGKQIVKQMVDEIVKELKDEDYEEATGEDRVTSDDDFGADILSTIERPEEPTQQTSSTEEEYDVDIILDKISKRGMESLTPGELKYLQSLGG
tara:strand:+ start:32 stop:1408 length:1377 start_codon:yes stop_codon:yes gene_type:complete